MKLEKIINREDGTKYQLIITAYLDSYRNNPIEYKLQLHYKGKGKRIWKSVPTELSDFQIRKLEMQERIKYHYDNMFRFVSKEEVYQAKLELWEQMKPLN